EMGAVRETIEQVLRAHEPYPALVIDRHWDLVSANFAFGSLVEGAAPHLLEPPVNVLRLSLHPEGLAPRIVNLEQWRMHLLERLGRDAVATGDPALSALREELGRYPGGSSGPPLDRALADLAVPLCVRCRDTELSFISTSTSFDAALDVTVAELSIESFFPADTQTHADLRASAWPNTGVSRSTPR